MTMAPLLDTGLHRAQSIPCSPLFLSKQPVLLCFTDEETEAQRRESAHVHLYRNDMFCRAHSTVAQQRKGLTAVVREDFIIKLGLELFEVILKEAQETQQVK